MSAEYHDFLEGTLRAALATGTTSGVTVKLKKVNNAYPTWPTVAHQIMVVQKTRTQTKVEKINVASGTSQTSLGVVTLGTLTRAISLSDGTDTSGTGTAQSFTQGALVYISWTTSDAEQAAMKDEVNTFTAKQTLSTVDFTTDGDEYLRFPNVTEAQRDALSASNGMQVYVTDGSNANRLHTYEGGAWGVSSSSTVADSSSTVAGKVELATTAEIRAETGNGGSGAPTVIPASATAVLKDDRIVLKDATELTIATGAITVVQPYHTVDTESDAASDDLDTITADVGAGEIIHIRAENDARTVVVKDGTGNILLSDSADYELDETDKSLTLIYDGTNWKELARAAGAASSTDYVIVRDVESTTSSSIGASTTAVVDYDTGQATVPSGRLVTGTAYIFEASGTVTPAAGTFSLLLYIGSTLVIQQSFTPTSTSAQVWRFKGRITGTEAAGASVTVKHYSEIAVGISGASAQDREIIDSSTGSVVTNSDQTLKFSAQFGTSNAGNVTALTSSIVEDKSPTAA